jgi:integrase/recombinase XerD
MTPDITIFVRHSADCKNADKGDFYRKCDCRKHLRWTINGNRFRKPAGTRSWQDAEKVKRDLEDQLSGRAVPSTNGATPVMTAVTLFLQDKKVQGVSPGVLKKYVLELGRLRVFCEKANAFTVQGITRDLITGYCATWEAAYPSSTTRSKVRERMKSFLRYCYECQWLDRIPNVPIIKVDEPPTLPLEGDEYSRLLDALHVVNPRRWDGKKSTQGLTADMHPRLHGLLQLMRWSGLAIRDALSLPKTGLEWDASRDTFRVVTSRQKTGTHVSVILPPDVSRELAELSRDNPAFVFFPGESLNFQELAKTYTNRYIRPAFEAAKIPCGTHMVSHRLRDTFAVDLLNKGVSIEEVAAALGDTVRTVEKHYAKWMKSRQNRLDNSISGAWETPKEGKLRVIRRTA